MIYIICKTGCTSFLVAGLDAPYPYETNPATAAAKYSNDDFSYTGICSYTLVDPPGFEPGTVRL